MSHRFPFVCRSDRCRLAVLMSSLLATVLAVSLFVAGQVPSLASDCRPSLSPRQRFGFVATSTNWPQSFDYGQLHAGWYVDFVHTADRPTDLDRALVIRTYTGYILDSGRLGLLVDANPGAMWLVGNEPDCIWQDNLHPEEYARIYHNLYAFIKSRDRSAQVAVGGIVQPTPLRLEYLDRVLAAYQARYRQPLPTDLWHIHNAILNEQRGGWGADIPPGITATQGVVRDIQDNDDVVIFRDQIWAFREWMTSRGYGGYPLIVTEYGVLMPAMYGFDVARVNAFMSATFEFFLNATHPSLGDPDDGRRLVQRWAWFSLDVPRWEDSPGGFNGNLFHPATGVITPFGQNFGSHTASLPVQLFPDLAVGAWHSLPSWPPVSPSEVATRTLQLRVVNAGTAAAGAFAVDMAYEGPRSGSQRQLLAGLPPSSAQWLTFTLRNLPPGGYSLQATLDPDGAVTEAAECNNRLDWGLVVGAEVAYLPLVTSWFAGADPDTLVAPEPLTPAAGSHPPGAPGSLPSAAGGRSSRLQEFSVPTPASYPAQLAFDRAGVLWITQFAANQIASFDPTSGQWREYAIPTTDSQPWGLAIDSAGNVWFAETRANQIGKLNAATGVVSEYPVPTPQSTPWEVAISGGKVFFTEKDGNKIGRLDPASGQIDEFPLPTPGAQPSGIDARGPNVWFVETAAAQLGWLYGPTGVIQEIGSGDGPGSLTRNSAPQDIAIGGDGTEVWFTEKAADQIGHFSLSTVGFVSEFPMPTAGSEPYSIVLDRMGLRETAWFTQRAANKLGRLIWGYPVREYFLPAPDRSPTGLAIDGAGCVWYTAPPLNLIGQFCLSLNEVFLPLVLKH
jgi:streptogramin lyase